MGKAKKTEIGRMAVLHSMVKEQWLFIDISLPLTAIMDGKKHWLLVVEDDTDYAWSYFLKKRSELKDMMM